MEILLDIQCWIFTFLGCQVYSILQLTTYTLLCKRSPQNFHITGLKFYPLNNLLFPITLTPGKHILFIVSKGLTTLDTIFK